MEAVASPRHLAAPGWIVSARFDTWLLWGGWMVPWLLWALYVQSEAMALIAMMAFFVLDRGHLPATWYLTLLDRNSMRSSGWFYGLGLVALVAVGWCLPVDTTKPKLPTLMWHSILLYWGYYHIVRQHYGFLRLYQVRSGGRDRALFRWQIWTLYSGLAYPFLWKVSTHTGLDPNLLIVLLPAWVAPLDLALFVVCSVVTLLRSRDLPLLYLLLAISNFFVSLLVLAPGNFLLGLMMITIWHDIQYGALTWWVGHRRYQRDDELGVLGGLFKPQIGSAGILLALTLLGAMAVMSLQGIVRWNVSPPTMQTMHNVALALVYSHYLFDGHMWQLGKNRQLSTDLGL